MDLENLKKIIYQDTRYNFIFTDFEYAFSSNQLFGGHAINEDIYTACLFLGPHTLCEIGVGIKPEKKSWDVELIKKTRANLPLPSSFEAHNNMLPSNRDIEQEFLRLLKNFDKTTFVQEPTLPEVLEKLEHFFCTLMKKYDMDYVTNSFSDKLMLEITKKYDLNNSEIKSVIFDDKSKGIFHKKIASKLVRKDTSTHAIKKI